MKAKDIIILGGVAVGGYMIFRAVQSLNLDPTGFVKGATQPVSVGQGVFKTVTDLLTGNLSEAIPGISAEPDRLAQTLATNIVLFTDPALHQAYTQDVQAYNEAIASNDKRIDEYINNYEQITGVRLETPEEIYARMTDQQLIDAGLDKLYPELMNR